MRVLIAAGIYPPDIGGPATYAQMMAQALVRDRHEVTVICYSDVSRKSIEDGVLVVRIRRVGSVGTAAAYFLKLATIARHYDVLFAQGPVVGGVQCMVLRLFSGLPYVVKVTGDYAWEQAQAIYGITDSIDKFQTRRGGLPFKIRLLRSLQRQVSKRAAIVIVPGHYLGSMVTSWGIAAERCRVIYNGISLSPEYAAVAPATVRAFARDGTKLVLSVGRLVPWKGFDTLIALWPKVVAAVPAARLCILGSGPEEATLRSAITASGVSKSMHLIHASGSEVRASYPLATLFVLNSSYEGLSHTILEAQTAGLACAVARVGGNPELISDGESGVLFHYNDDHEIRETLIRLLRDDALRQELGAKAHAFAAQFSEERMYRETEVLLKSI